MRFFKRGNYISHWLSRNSEIKFLLKNLVLNDKDSFEQHKNKNNLFFY